MGGVAGGWATGQTPRRQRCGSKKTQKDKDTKGQKRKGAGAGKTNHAGGRRGGGSGAGAANGKRRVDHTKHGETQHTYICEGEQNTTQTRKTGEAGARAGTGGAERAGGGDTQNTHTETQQAARKSGGTRGTTWGTRSERKTGAWPKASIQNKQRRAHTKQKDTRVGRGVGAWGAQGRRQLQKHTRERGGSQKKRARRKGGGRGQGVTRRGPGQRAEGVGGR